jgi:serine/threonine protein phosphatase PrpC
MANLTRNPTFVVGNEEQRNLLSMFQRREQTLSEDYMKNKPLCFNARGYQKTHPAKASQGKTDADATLVSPMLLGVADGVSQIEDFGIDPSVLPQELLKACDEIALDQLLPDGSGKKDDPYLGPIPLMRRAFESTESLGSTTILLSILDNSTRIHGKLHPMIAVLAIGDCEVLILRRCGGRQNQLEAVFHTEMQRIESNAQMPLQVARVDDRVDANFDESITIDVIERGSAVHCMSAYEGDILVQGSDGLFDNLFLDEIVDICNANLSPTNPQDPFVPEQPAVLEKIARQIVLECHKKTDRAPDGGLIECPIGRGGKVDDTCCVVGEVIEWTERHRKVWGRDRRQSRRGVCGFGLFRGLGLFGGAYSDYGSETGSEYESGSDYDYVSD